MADPCALAVKKSVQMANTMTDRWNVDSNCVGWVQSSEQLSMLNYVRERERDGMSVWLSTCFHGILTRAQA